MTQLWSPGHPSREDLLDYWQEHLSEEERTRLEEHLANCDACAGRSSQVNRLATFWDGWRERVGAEEPVPAGVVGLAKELRTALQQGIAPAVGRWASELLGSLRVSFAPGRANIGDIGLRGVVRSSALFAQAVPAPIRLRGAVRTRGAVQREGSSPPAGVTQVQLGAGATGPRLIVQALGEEGRVEVELRGWPEQEEPPRLLLVSAAEAEGPEPRILRWKAEPDCYLAQSNVEPGEYILAVFEAGSSLGANGGKGLAD